MPKKITLTPDALFLTHTNSARITTFLNALLAGPASDEGCSISLFDMTNQNDSRLVRTFTVEAAMDENGCTRVVKEIDQVAMDDAASSDPETPYVLNAQTVSGSPIGSIKLTYALLGRGKGSLSMAEGLPYHERAFQFAEFALMLWFQGNGSTVDSLQRRVAQQDALLERSLEREARLIHEKQELASRKAERDLAIEAMRRQQDLETLKETARIERNAMLQKTAMDKLNVLIPLAINYMAGQSVVAVPGNPTDAMISVLVDNLTDADLAALQANLRPELWALVMRLVQQRREGKASPPPATAAVSGDVFAPLPTAQISAGIELIKRDLLPWAAEHLASGQDPVEARPSEVMLLASLLRAMSAADIEKLLTTDPRLNDDQRRTLTAVMRRLGLGAGPTYGQTTSPSSGVQPAQRQSSA